MSSIGHNQASFAGAVSEVNLVLKMSGWDVLDTEMEITPEGKGGNVASEIKLGSYLVH